MWEETSITGEAIIGNASSLSLWPLFAQSERATSLQLGTIGGDLAVGV